MDVSMRLAMVLFCGSVAFAGGELRAASPATATTVVTVKKLCPSCGKKIVQRLSEMPHVAEASMNVDERTILVRCKPSGTVSPRAVWETVERGGEQPVRLAGPSGTFTTKPKR